MNKIPAFIKNPPNSKTVFTRDNKIFANTRDHLFICAALRNWKNNITHLSYFKNVTGLNIATLTDHSGNYYHPVTGEGMILDGLTLHSTFRKNTLKKYITDGFYNLRAHIITGKTDKTIEINGSAIFNDGEAIVDSVNELNNTLTWKFSSDNDISHNFINHLKTGNNCFIKTINPNYAFCPVDGWVKVIHGDIKSPHWTWNALCGRHYKIILCPECLGVFHSWLHCFS